MANELTDVQRSTLGYVGTMAIELAGMCQALDLAMPSYILEMAAIEARDLLAGKTQQILIERGSHPPHPAAPAG